MFKAIVDLPAVGKETSAVTDPGSNLNSSLAFGQGGIIVRCRSGPGVRLRPGRIRLWCTGSLGIGCGRPGVYRRLGLPSRCLHHVGLPHDLAEEHLADSRERQIPRSAEGLDVPAVGACAVGGGADPADGAVGGLPLVHPAALVVGRGVLGRSVDEIEHPSEAEGGECVFQRGAGALALLHLKVMFAQLHVEVGSGVGQGQLAPQLLPLIQPRSGPGPLPEDAVERAQEPRCPIGQSVLRPEQVVTHPAEVEGALQLVPVRHEGIGMGIRVCLNRLQVGVQQTALIVPAQRVRRPAALLGPDVRRGGEPCVLHRGVTEQRVQSNSLEESKVSRLQRSITVDGKRFPDLLAAPRVPLCCRSGTLGLHRRPARAALGIALPDDLPELGAVGHLVGSFALGTDHVHDESPPAGLHDAGHVLRLQPVGFSHSGDGLHPGLRVLRKTPVRLIGGRLIRIVGLKLEVYTVHGPPHGNVGEASSIPTPLTTLTK